MFWNATQFRESASTPLLHPEIQTQETTPLACWHPSPLHLFTVLKDCTQHSSNCFDYLEVPAQPLAKQGYLQILQCQLSPILCLP